MDEKYLETIVQYLIKIANNNSSTSDKGITEKLDEVIAAVDVLKTNIESVDTHIQSNTQALNNGIGVVNDKQDAANNNITSISQKMLVSGIINPTHIAAVAAGNTTFDQHVVLCNITNDNISVTIMAADDSQNTTIILAPGWNPVVVKSITGAVENTLVYGY